MGQTPRLRLGISFPTDTTPQRLTYIYETEHDTAFQSPKTHYFSSCPFDPAKPLILTCDASEYGIGAVLLQKMDNGDEKPIAYTQPC